MGDITIYTTSWCGECRVAKQYFDQIGADYTEIDIEDWDDPRGHLEELTGGRTVPQIVVGDRVLGDYPRFLELVRTGRMEAELAGGASA